MKRPKRRYLALRLDIEGLLDQRTFLDSVWHTISQLYGEIGASQTGIALIEYSDETKTAILRVSIKAVEMVRASLALITRANEKDLAVHVVGVSGTLKALRRHLQK